jgi:hypothetical protein
MKINYLPDALQQNLEKEGWYLDYQDHESDVTYTCTNNTFSEPLQFTLNVDTQNIESTTEAVYELKCAASRYALDSYLIKDEDMKYGYTVIYMGKHGEPVYADGTPVNVAEQEENEAKEIATYRLSGIVWEYFKNSPRNEYQAVHKKYLDKKYAELQKNRIELF